MTSTSSPADFSFSFQPVDENLGIHQRWSTWLSVERSARGPEPRPDWLVTDDSAVDTELGVLKGGKEADVHLLHRASRTGPDRAVVMAAKRYRTHEHRTFHRSTAYTEGRRPTRNTRDARAMAKGTAHGRAVSSAHWAHAEWAALTTLWCGGLPVPYPVQIDGTEILMEYVSVDGAAAPRLAQSRPDADLLGSYERQLWEAMLALARRGWAHGDLSAYNVLAQGERLVLIDLPQVVDVVANPQGLDLLQRDCRNVCQWLRGKGADVDEDEWFGELVAEVFTR
ncbi:MAG: serine/threonine protein kinase [Actinomycetota bacterium]|nr:serine/threonine protein kinase [Actinomycetota bacterium]